MTMLTITNLSVRFTDDQAAQPAVNNVSLTLDRGETVALVGESGSGKSVTALTILRLLETVARVETRGSVIYNDQELLIMSEDQIRHIRGNRIAMVFQEPMTSLNPVYTVGHQLLEPLLLHQHMTRDAAKTEAIRLLNRCGIAEAESKFEHFPHQLSGGQRQRVMLAMALACRPDLLIADEPTTALDVTIQAQILALIKEIQVEMGMAILLITHDLVMVKKIAERVYIMKQGEMIESGKTETIFDQPREAYTKELLASIPHRIKTYNTNENRVVWAKNLTVDFTEKAAFFRRKAKMTRAVDSVDIAIRQGTTFGIVGESGSGKSTLGLALLRLLNASGEIRYGTIDLLACPARQMLQYRRHLQIVFQDPFSSLSPRQTIGQIVGEGLRVHEPGMT
ncbi:MAG: ATP-binding cassette domain-containing protein, partial [Desulfobulbaceae bacterium]|nr:ATP-binding cassette domain-containing protein [Desulfobulbaceae bacterium]